MITTSPPATQKKENLLAYGSVFILWLTSLYLSFIANNTEALTRYNLTRAKLHVIQVTLSLPTLFIWSAMLFATLSFYRYSRQIAGSKDSPAFRYISYGLCFMLVTSVLGGLAGNFRVLLSETAADPVAVKNNFVVIANYIAVVGALGLYWYLCKGSQSLLKSIKSRLDISKHYLTIVMPFLLLAAVYLYLIFANPARRVSADPQISPAFALPDALILLTVAVPYLISWFLGILALVGIHRYQEKTSGIFYKQLFKKLVNGMTLVIVLTIVLQLITQFSGFWSSKGLSAILTIIAVIYLILIVALLAVAQAARQLNKIETIDLKH